MPNESVPHTDSEGVFVINASHELTDPTPDEQASGIDAIGRLKVDSVGELIAALPAMLGFVPARSMVMVLLSSTSDRTPARRAIRTVIRVDLDTVTEPVSAEQLVSMLESVWDARRSPRRWR